MNPARGWCALLAVSAWACTSPAPPRAVSGDAVVIAVPAGAESLAPNRFRDEFATTVLRNVFEPLVDLDGDLAVKPGLAESWDSPDDLTWRFRLRAGVRLHDGRPLDAALVCQSLEATLHEPGSRKGSLLNVVDTVTVVDASTIAVHTRRPFATLGNRLASVLVDVPGRGAGDPPVGTGPYRIQSWTPDGDTVLESFAGYWNGPAPIHRVEFRVMREAPARAAALRRAEVDFVVDAPAEEMDALGGTAGLRTVAQRGLRILYLGMDSSRESSTEGPSSRNPFRDRRVREALASAIDRAALVKEPLGGHADVVDELVTPEILGFNGHLPPIAYSPGHARELLAQAGWAQGFDVPLDFVSGRYRALDAVVARLAGDLAKVGIRVQPRGSTLRASQEKSERGDPPLLGLRGWLDSYNEAVATYEYLIHTRGEGYGLANVSLYANPEVDRLLQRATAEPGSDLRQRLLRRVAELVRADLPVVPLYRQRDLYALDAGLAFQPRLDRRVRAELLRWTQAPRRTPVR